MSMKRIAPFRAPGIAAIMATAVLLAAPTALGDTGSGQLDAIAPDGTSLGSCPLRHTDVEAAISGFVARVTVEQQFENSFEEPIEAVYTFPLSSRGAVDRMTMHIGGRTIEGVIKERGEARKMYEAARDAGQAASLLDQERPNIFTQAVANIMPGEKVDIRISYVEVLPYGEGAYTFAFPMTIGPRYNPAGQVPDSGKIAPPVPPKGKRAGHDISLRVNLDAGVPVTNIDSELHEVEITREGAAAAKIALAKSDTLPNRDFVMRYAVAGDRIEDAVLTHKDERGSFFTVVMQPPMETSEEEITPKELIFVIDCSGSMRGFPIEKAKKAMRRCIETLNPEDTFNLVSFAGGVGYCFNKAVPNTRANQQQALEYLDNLQGGGGTEMMKAVNAALQSAGDPGRLRVVCFMTDGFIGNDMQILGAVQRNAGQARVFAFGIGNSVNRFLIEGMAREGRGAAEIVTLESDSDEAVDRFWQRVRSPLLRDIELSFEGMSVDEVYPNPGSVPDLFAGQPLVITGRCADTESGNVTVKGMTSTGPFERNLAVNFDDADSQRDVLAVLWARERVDALMRQDWQGMQSGAPDESIHNAILHTGLQYNLVTQFTSFVAVENRVVNENGKSKTVQVPVEMPDGVSYEGIFGDGRSEMAVASSPAQLGRKAAAGVGQMVAPAPVATAPQGGGFGGGGGLGGTSTAEETAIRDRVSADSARPQPELREDNDEDDGAWQSKLGSDLRAMLNGPQAQRHGGSASIEVYVKLSANDESHVSALRKAGADIKAHNRAGRTLWIRIPLRSIRTIARMEFVEGITIGNE